MRERWAAHPTPTADVIQPSEVPSGHLGWLSEALVSPPQGLMNPVSAGEPAHYISTLPFLGQDAQDPSPFLKKDIERFLWNFLAARTASGPAADGGAQDYLSLSFLSAVLSPRAQSLASSNNIMCA